MIRWVVAAFAALSLGATFGTSVQDLPLSHVANNAALQKIYSTAFTIILRDGVNTPGDSPPTMYRSSPLQCPLNGGQGDGGAQVRSADNRCWLAIFDYTNPQAWGADPSGNTDSTSAMLSAALWIGANKPGGRLDCGGQGNHYLIGSFAVPATPLFPLIHPVDWYDCYFIAAAMTSTTDIWQVAPATATDADAFGWGWEYVTVESPLNTPHWRHTWSFSDGGNGQIIITRLKFHDIFVAPSVNRAGHDLDMTATVAGQGLIVYSTLGPNVRLFESVFLHGLGDSDNLNGFTVGTDGVVDASKTCVDISNSTGGAGQTSINDLNCTTYGGAKFTNTYGTHLRGGVFECEGAHIASASGAFLTLIGVNHFQIDAVQAQGGGCSVPPPILSVDSSSINVSATFIEGPGVAGTDLSGRYLIDAAASPTVAVTSFDPVWLIYTPTLTCGAGTLTSSGGSGRYKWVPGTQNVEVMISAAVITNGTCSGNVTATLPFKHQNTIATHLMGREDCVSGKALAALLNVNSALVNMFNYDGTYPGGNGSCPTVSGAYEAQR